MVAYNKKSPVELVFKPLRFFRLINVYNRNIRKQIYQIANRRNLMTKELPKYLIAFLKTTEKASLIYQKMKKRKNQKSQIVKRNLN